MRHRPFYKEGDQVMIFVNPNTNSCAEGLAILKEFIDSDLLIERWSVEFLDQPGITYPRFISKPKKDDPSYYRYSVHYGHNIDIDTVGNYGNVHSGIDR